MSDGIWVCQKCEYSRKGKEDGFQLLGNGFVKCPRCQAVHFVSPPFPPPEGKNGEREQVLMLY